MKRRHVHKKPAAVIDLASSTAYLRGALEELCRAENALECSGWRGASRGIHQAGERVKSWLDKINVELAALEKGEI